jgi:hypothetical protein
VTRSVLLALVLVLVLAGCGGGDDERSASPLQTGAEVRLSVDSDGITTPLTQLGDSGQTGEVTLTPAGDDQTFVVVRVDQSGAEETAATLHNGSCANLGGVVTQLEPVGERPSESTVDQSLQALLDEPHAVTVGDGPDACADVAGPGE